MQHVAGYAWTHVVVGAGDAQPGELFELLEVARVRAQDARLVERRLPEPFLQLDEQRGLVVADAGVEVVLGPQEDPPIGLPDPVGAAPLPAPSTVGGQGHGGERRAVRIGTVGLDAERDPRDVLLDRVGRGDDARRGRTAAGVDIDEQEPGERDAIRRDRPGAEQVIDQGIPLALAQQPAAVLEELLVLGIGLAALAGRMLEGGGGGRAGHVVVRDQALQRVAVDAEADGEPDRGLEPVERGDDTVREHDAAAQPGHRGRGGPEEQRQRGIGGGGEPGGRRREVRGDGDQRILTIGRVAPPRGTAEGRGLGEREARYVRVGRVDRRPCARAERRRRVLQQREPGGRPAPGRDVDAGGRGDGHLQLGSVGGVDDRTRERGVDRDRSQPEHLDRLGLVAADRRREPGVDLPRGGVGHERSDEVGGREPTLGAIDDHADPGGTVTVAGVNAASSTMTRTPPTVANSEALAARTAAASAADRP